MAILSLDKFLIFNYRRPPLQGCKHTGPLTCLWDNTSIFVTHQNRSFAIIHMPAFWNTMKLPSIVTMSLMGVVSDVTGKKSDSNSAAEKKKAQTPEKETCL